MKLDIYITNKWENYFRMKKEKKKTSVQNDGQGKGTQVYDCRLALAAETWRRRCKRNCLGPNLESCFDITWIIVLEDKLIKDKSWINFPTYFCIVITRVACGGEIRHGIEEARIMFQFEAKISTGLHFVQVHAYRLSPSFRPRYHHQISSSCLVLFVSISTWSTNSSRGTGSASSPSSPSITWSGNIIFYWHNRVFIVSIVIAGRRCCWQRVIRLEIHPLCANIPSSLG